MKDDDEQTPPKKSPSTWSQRTSRTTPTIEVGDRVCYSKKFLQSTGQHTGPVPFARGVVTALIPLGDAQLAEVDWNNDEIPKRVHVANLSRITEKGVHELP